MKELDNIIKWVEALESGKYKKCTGRLGDHEYGFCSLGVGCFILDINYSPYDFISHDFAESVGLIDASGTFINYEFYYGQHSLVSLNDATTVGFKNIADFIKNHPDWIFKPQVAQAVKEHFENI